MSVNPVEPVLRLVVAGTLGSVIGLQRELHGRPAGFRTHILVALGSCLFMLVSLEAFQGPGGFPLGDPGRIAAQVVSGIGFLGAGAIMKQGNTVSGLTTAASLWVVAGIGLAVGAGLYLVSAVVTLTSWLTLSVLSRVEIGKRRSSSPYTPQTFEASADLCDGTSGDKKASTGSKN